jgi:hypothetical protein
MTDALSKNSHAITTTPFIIKKGGEYFSTNDVLNTYGSSTAGSRDKEVYS